MSLYGRKWKILVMDANDTEALNLSDLRVVFNVRRARETQNYATVQIYNLSADTERSIILNGDRIVIEAGYEAAQSVTDENGNTTEQMLQYGVIFDGKIIYPSRHKDSNTDYVLSLLCVDGQNVLQKNFIAKTVNRGLNQRQMLDVVCNQSENVVAQATISDGLSTQTLPRGKVFFGATKDYVSDVCRGNAATYSVEGDQLTVFKLTDEIKDEALVVTPTTGLIGMPSQTQFGASWTLLLNPNIHIAGLVQLKNSEINEVSPTGIQSQQAPLDDEWIYQVMEYTHRGDTRGNEWYTECSGISRYGRGSLPALIANAKQNAM